MKTISKLLCATAFCFVAGAAQAEGDSERSVKNQYDAAVSQADADYKANTAACQGREGNEKDVCIQQARDQRDRAKADALAARKTNLAQLDAQSDKNDSDYKLAKARCDALSGDQKDACISSAKVKYHQ
jgi:hypothetical protein